MFMTLLLLILGAAILIFFSTEFAGMAKRILDLPGMKLCLPLVLISWLIERYAFWVLWGLLWLQKGLWDTQAYLSEVFSFSRFKMEMAQGSLLLLAAMIPFLLLRWLKKRKPYNPSNRIWFYSTLVWLVVAILLLIKP